MQLHEGAFELSGKTNNYQQPRLIISSNVSSIKKTCLSSPHKLPQMWLRLQFSLLPVQPAGQIRPHQLCTLLGSLLLQGPLQTPPSPRAPPPHPLPFLRSPEATQVPEEAYRAGATALNACWRPLVAPLRTITTPMGLAGPEPWRTSTRSTETTRIERFVFCQRKMQEPWSDTEHSAHKSLYPFVFVLGTFPVSWVCRANNARRRNPAPLISVALFQIQRQKLITRAEGCNQKKIKCSLVFVSTVRTKRDRKHNRRQRKLRESHPGESNGFNAPLFTSTSCSPLPTVPQEQSLCHHRCGGLKVWNDPEGNSPSHRSFWEHPLNVYKAALSLSRISSLSLWGFSTKSSSGSLN